MNETDARPDDELDLEAISELFLSEYRQGRRPDVEAYAERFPEFGEEIRDLFPALALLEKGGSTESLASFSNCVGSQGRDPVDLKRLKNFKIIREIGRGGMGVVYEAWDETLDRVVALKVMKIFPGEEEQTIRRFQREAKTAARLHHTNIVPVYGSDAVDDHFFYAMQLIEGVSLDHFLRMKRRDASKESGDDKKLRRKFSVFHHRCEPVTVDGQTDDQTQTEKFDPPVARPGIPASLRGLFNPGKTTVEETRDARGDATVAESSTASDAEETTEERGQSAPSQASDDGAQRAREELIASKIFSDDYCRRVAELGLQAARALDYASRHNVVHRDVKPSNLIVDYDGTLWITDFGLAKPINENDLTRQGQLVGTLRYLAPEALEGNFSPLTDVYSLGLTLYEMLTFTPAFDETNYAKLLSQVAHAEPVRPRKINPAIPRDLETVILKAIEHSPEKRYDAAGLADDLQRFLEDRPVSARRVRQLERIWRLCRRNRLVASLTAMIAALLCFIFVYGSVNYVRLQRLSTRAEDNLILALDSFDELFKTLVASPDAKFDFFNDYSIYYPSAAEGSISEKDAEALDEMLGFYEQFANANRENGQDVMLIYRSALAYFRTGAIRRALGSDNFFSAYVQALEYYDQCLSVGSTEIDREQLVIETAQLVVVILENAPPGPKRADADHDPDRLLKYCQKALDYLDTVPKSKPDYFRVAQQQKAHLLFARAVFNVMKLRSGASEDSPGFFAFRELPSLDSLSEEETCNIERDFSAVRLKIGSVDKVETAEGLKLASKYFAAFALWKSTIGKPLEALEQIETAEKYASKRRKLYPDQISAVSSLGIDFVRSKIISDVLQRNQKVSDQFDPDRELVDAQNRSLKIAEELVSRNPDSSFNDLALISVCGYYAKAAAITGRMEDADRLLKAAGDRLEEFMKKRPRFDISPVFSRIQSGRVEFLARQGRFEEARRELERYRAYERSLEGDIALFEARLTREEEEISRNSPDDESSEMTMRFRRARRKRMEDRLERMKRRTEGLAELDAKMVRLLEDAEAGRLPDPSNRAI